MIYCNELKSISIFDNGRLDIKLYPSLSNRFHEYPTIARTCYMHTREKEGNTRILYLPHVCGITILCTQRDTNGYK